MNNRSGFRRSPDRNAKFHFGHQALFVLVFFASLFSFAMGQTSSQNAPPRASGLPSPGCPIDHKSPAASACPVPHDPSPKLAECPIDHESIDSRNQMPNLSQQAASSQSIALPTSRTESSIPRDPATKWEYPSPQQFYNALARKGHETPEELAHVETMVEIHNFLNEQAWQEVLKWEKKAYP